MSNVNTLEYLITHFKTLLNKDGPRNLNYLKCLELVDSIYKHELNKGNSMTVKSVEQLDNEIKELTSFIETLEEQKQEKLNKVFDDSGDIQEFLFEVENGECDSYSFGLCGDVVAVFYRDFPNFKDVTKYLDAYLNERAIYSTDSKNGIYETFVGDSIIVDSDGIVWDQEKGVVFLTKDEYENDTQLNELIEGYMDETGIYPSVFNSDYYGNLSPRNTLTLKVV